VAFTIAQPTSTLGTLQFAGSYLSIANTVYDWELSFAFRRIDTVDSVSGANISTPYFFDVDSVDQEILTNDSATIKTFESQIDNNRGSVVNLTTATLTNFMRLVDLEKATGGTKARIYNGVTFTSSIPALTASPNLNATATATISGNDVLSGNAPDIAVGDTILVVSQNNAVTGANANTTVYVNISTITGANAISSTVQFMNDTVVANSGSTWVNSTSSAVTGTFTATIYHYKGSLNLPRTVVSDVKASDGVSITESGVATLPTLFVNSNEVTRWSGDGNYYLGIGGSGEGTRVDWDSTDGNGVIIVNTGIVKATAGTGISVSTAQSSTGYNGEQDLTIGVDTNTIATVNMVETGDYTLIQNIQADILTNASRIAALENALVALGGGNANQPVIYTNQTFSFSVTANANSPYTYNATTSITATPNIEVGDTVLVSIDPSTMAGSPALDANTTIFAGKAVAVSTNQISLPITLINDSGLISTTGSTVTVSGTVMHFPT
jgi:hypothetical protein